MRRLHLGIAGGLALVALGQIECLDRIPQPFAQILSHGRGTHSQAFTLARAGARVPLRTIVRLHQPARSG